MQCHGVPKRRFRVGPHWGIGTAGAPCEGLGTIARRHSTLFTLYLSCRRKCENSTPQILNSSQYSLAFYGMSWAGEMNLERGRQPGWCIYTRFGRSDDSRSLLDTFRALKTLQKSDDRAAVTDRLSSLTTLHILKASLYARLWLSITWLGRDLDAALGIYVVQWRGRRRTLSRGYFKFPILCVSIHICGCWM